MDIGRREVRFGGSAVAIEYEGAGAAWAVDFLYRYVSPAADPPPLSSQHPEVGAGLVPAQEGALLHARLSPPPSSPSPEVGAGLVPAQEGAPLHARLFPPHVTYRIVERHGWLSLYRGEVLLYAGDSLGAAADRLMGDSCHELAEHSRDGLLFHAAALARPGGSLILPGTSGAGKSTLAAWLAARGWTYLTDEMVYVPAMGEGFAALTRPLNLKAPARQSLSGLFDLRPSEHVLPTAEGVLLSPALLNAGLPGSGGRQAPAAFVFSRYVPGGALEWGPLSPAQTGLALMECLVNARSLADHGFAQVARLARQSPGYMLRYGHFDQLDESIAALNV